MAWENSPFHRFYGWRILALIAVTMAYSYWFAVIGPYAKLEGLAPGMPFEGQFTYDGAFAAKTLGQLDAVGQRTKLISLFFDLPYMVLNALVFEALIAFGIRRMNLTKPVWSMLFILPIAFLIFDFAEDAFLALTVVSGSSVTGTLASLATPAKFITFMAASFAGLILSVLGLLFWLIKGRNDQSAS